MKNPWIKFIENLEETNLVLKEDKAVIDSFNQSTNETFKVHTEIMPAPFMGNVQTAPILLLTLNPGYDEKEDIKGYYEKYRPFWKNEIQHIKSIPELPLFCLDENYIKYSDYWNNKLKPLILETSKDKVAKKICKIQFFPYHSQKFKSISKKVLAKEGIENYLISQKYNFYLVEKAMERNALIIILRSRNMWFDAIPELEKYNNLYFTNSYLNTILSKNNLGETFPKIVNILNK